MVLFIGFLSSHKFISFMVFSLLFILTVRVLTHFYTSPTLLRLESVRESKTLRVLRTTYGIAKIGKENEVINRFNV